MLFLLLQLLTMFKPFFDCRLHLRSSTRCPHTNDQQSFFVVVAVIHHPKKQKCFVILLESTAKQTSGWLRLTGTALPEPGHGLGLKCLILNNHVSSFFVFRNNFKWIFCLTFSSSDAAAPFELIRIILISRSQVTTCGEACCTFLPKHRCYSQEFKYWTKRRGVCH